MKMETLEFIIHPDGRVQEAVQGLTGSSCMEITAEIEAYLGQVITQDLTSDFFNTSAVQTSQVVPQGTAEKF